MNRTKILFFCAGAVLAALLVWWLSAGERTPAGESGKRSPLDVIMTRTSIRAYRDCPVGADTVELLLRAAMAAPSAVNRQPWAFVVVDDRELLRELAGALPFAKMAARAPLAVVVCGDLSRNPGASGDWWVLGLPSDVVPLNLIPVGYPADNPAPKQKWNPANVRHNGWTE